MGLFRRRNTDEPRSEPAAIEPTATASESADSGDDDGVLDVVPPELRPGIDEFSVVAMEDEKDRWNCSIDFDEVYAYSYEERIGNIVGALDQVEGITHVDWMDREAVYVLTSEGADFVRSTFLRLMTEQLAAED